MKAKAAAVTRIVEAGLPAPGTFEAVARDWVVTVHEAKVSEAHAARTVARFENDVFPWIGRRPIGDIEPPELLTVLRRIEARGAIETAHRTKDACGQVFRFGIASGLCTRNPAADLREALRPVQTKHLAAIVEPGEVGKLLRDIVEYDGSPITRAALSLSALLLLRPGELRQMEWSWIDLDGATLSIPPETMKRTKDGKESGPPHIAAGRAGRDDPARSAAARRWLAVRVPVHDVAEEPLHEREHRAQRAAANGLRQRRHDRARLPRDGSNDGR